MSAAIVAHGVLCAVGRGYDQAWASVRAGLGRIGSSHVMNRHFDAIPMGLVPEDVLAPLPPEIESLPLPSRARRMLRLGAPVLRSVAPHAGERVKLYLGLPEPRNAMPSWMQGFALNLAKLAGITLDAPNSRVVPSGRAAALKALELALEALERDPTTRIVVGGVDTFLDLRLLTELDAEQRVHGPGVMDGFIPGEGAGFLVLAHESAPDTTSQGRRVLVQAAACTADAGHRYGSQPARGEGLAQAIEVLRARLGNASSPVSCTFAGLNGENFDSKQWGVARLRHRDFFAHDMVLAHPADCMGDTGAAAGAILTGLAATALAKGHRAGPALVWAASDHEPRGCALLSVANA